MVSLSNHAPGAKVRICLLPFSSQRAWFDRLATNGVNKIQDMPYAGRLSHGILSMSWTGLVLAIIGIWLALKVAGFFFKLLMWALVLFGAYWFLAPLLELPRPF